jgi:peptidoglycan hydrolase-like protein with peptidoglycan-binding domain
MSLRKIVSAVVTATTLVTMAGPAFAVTAEELLQQIQQLQQQLNQLMQQYQQLTGQAPAGVPAACQGVTFTRDLKLGMSGADVKCLQALLNQDPATRVAESGPGSPGNETTYFGPKTRAAVIKFQEKYAAEILTPVGLTAGTGFVGAKTRAKLNALLQAGAVVTPPAPPAPAFEPMKVKVAEDTPVAANIQRGTPNNPVLKIVLSGSETETVNVSGITLTQYGNAPDAAVTAVRLWDENGVQLGSDRQLIGGKAIFVLVPTLQIPAKGTRTITVTVDVHSDDRVAPTLTTVQLGVNAATDITGAAFTGTFPVKGNLFTIVPAGQFGSLSVASLGALPSTTVRIGQKDVVLNRFIVSAGAREDVVVRQVMIENTQDTNPIVDTDITNIRIREVGGAVVGGPVNLSAKKAVINLTGVTLTKGTSKRFEVVADVVSGKSRNVKLDVTKVIGVGATSGISIVAPQGALGSTVLIESGYLSVVQSANHPVGTAAAFVATLNAKPIGIFSVRAVGEDILINKIVLNFNFATGTLSAVGLYDGDSLVSDLKDTVTAGDQTFTLSWTVPANTTKDLTVKAVTKNAGSDTGNAITVTLKSTSEGYGLASGEKITPSADTHLSAVTVYSAGTFTATLDDQKTPFNQGVLVGLNDVLLGAIKVRATREDMKLYKLVLTSQVGNATSNAVASVTLYDESGNALSNSVNVANGVFTINPEDLLTNVIFPKDTYKTILVKGRVASATTDLYFLKIAAASDFQAVGVESEQSANVSVTTPLNLGNDTQGKFVFTDKVIEMKKNASSPSGSISRSATNVSGVAIWDVTNPTGGDITVSGITLTSKTGLPSGTGVTTTEFKLIDETGTTVTSSASSISANTVAFSGFSWTIPAGATKQLKLLIDTTNTAHWPSNTALQWTVAAYNHVTFSTTGAQVGYAGTVWSIPADTNVVTLP